MGRVIEDKSLREIRICIITGQPELRKLIYDRPHRAPEGFLSKPIDEEQLILNVRKVLKIPHEKESAKPESSEAKKGV